VAEESEAKGPLAFLQTTREELEKVVWPSRQQLLSESVAVLSIVVVFALFIYAIDKGFSWVALQIFK
jgi:preprotein translocase subunit SecE